MSRSLAELTEDDLRALIREELAQRAAPVDAAHRPEEAAAVKPQLEDYIEVRRRRRMREARRG
jgi:hypothetical protein